MRLNIDIICDENAKGKHKDKYATNMCICMRLKNKQTEKRNTSKKIFWSSERSEGPSRTGDAIFWRTSPEQVGSQVTIYLGKKRTTFVVQKTQLAKIQEEVCIDCKSKSC